jgi:hypothetical protein
MMLKPHGAKERTVQRTDIFRCHQTEGKNESQGVAAECYQIGKIGFDGKINNHFRKGRGVCVCVCVILPDS